jgi:hypothetical protein
MVQIDEVALYAVDQFREFGSEPVAVIDTPIFDAMDPVAPGVMTCSDRGLLFVPPQATASVKPLLLAVTFRPIVRRQAAETTTDTLREAA